MPRENRGRRFLRQVVDEPRLCDRGRRRAETCRANARTMCVARDQVDEAPLDEDSTRGERRSAEPPLERGGGDLDERSGLDQQAQATGMGRHLTVPFRMGEHGGHPRSAYRVDRRVEREGPACVGELEQDVRPATGVAEPSQLVVR